MRVFLSLYRIFVSVVLATLFLFSYAARAWAADEFRVDLQSSYSVRTDGTTHVALHFTLTNNVSTVYATQYALEVGSTRVENVRVTEGGKTLHTTVTPQSNKTAISFTFADTVVGKDQKHEFTVEYDSRDIAVKTGKILEVSIPKLANGSTFSTYTVTVDVEEQYGPPTIASPQQFTTSIEKGRAFITFADQTASGGVSLLFGKEQIAKMDITYHLENPQEQRGITHIALPSDNTYQRVYYTRIEPPPTHVEQDADGNWLAYYELESKQRLDVQVAGYVVVTLEPRSEAQLLTKHPGEEYVQEQPYWPVSDPHIQKIARQLKTAPAIYEYVVQTLSYNYNRLEQTPQRLGAKEALLHPSNSVCLEFTDLFVTLARAAGIPARSVSGYAYTHNEKLRPLSLVKDVLHSWAEYWDEETGHWVAVDPTWENTTGGVDYFNRLDFNHIAFATHGLSSEKPYPAGMYKYAETDSKDIQVTFVTELPTAEDTFETDMMLHPSALFGLKHDYALTVYNTSLHAVYGVPYSIQTGTATNPLLVKGTLTLPPLSHTTIPVQLPRKELLKARSQTVHVQVANQVFEHDISIKSAISDNLPLLAVTGLVVLCCGLIAFISWRLLVPRRNRKRSVRRKS